MNRSVFLRRLAFSLGIGLVIGAAITEIAFYFLREVARPPQTIVITIPLGTAEQIKRGQQPLSLPENMLFVVGDVLVVVNEDTIPHQLGPLWIPPGTSASLELNRAESLAYECSFQTSNYLGLEVRQPLTLWTRLVGILSAGLPLGILLAIYSLVMPAGKSS